MWAKVEVVKVEAPVSMAVYVVPDKATTAADSTIQSTVVSPASSLRKLLKNLIITST